MRERRLAHRRVARRRDWSATRSMLPPVLRGLVPLAMLWPAVLDPTAAKETVHDRSSSSFDWGALSRLRALPASAHVDEQDCEALAAALPVPMPLVAPPPQEITQGYLPERLQLGQHISGFKLTSFVRRIPLLAPQLPATSSSMATPTSVQVHPGVNADAVALSRVLHSRAKQTTTPTRCLRCRPHPPRSLCSTRGLQNQPFPNRCLRFPRLPTRLLVGQ